MHMCIIHVRALHQFMSLVVAGVEFVWASFETNEVIERGGSQEAT